MKPPWLHGFDDLVIRKLDGAPPAGFDCGREAQNRFLYDRAWFDQQQRVSTTYLYQSSGILAGYATVCMDALVLGTREKPEGLRYKNIASLKLLQLGVHRAFQNRGLGTLAVFDIVQLALRQFARVGCRYVTLDAQPDLAAWYQSLGFEINKVMQKQRITAAAGKAPDEIPVSMRFDLREV
jgi:GNAT superfamily N-acetyltransferase